MGTIYRRLAESRNALGLKQREIASLSGTSLRAYARYESGEGERDIPSSVLDVYAQNGINTNWLLTGEGEIFLPQASISVDAPPDEEIAAAMKALQENVTLQKMVLMIRDMPEEKQRSVFEHISEKKQMIDMEREMRELREKVAG